MQNFETCLVNRDAAAAGQAGNFQFLNLCTSETVEAWPIPRGAASRVSRERILELLMRGVEVRVGFFYSFILFCFVLFFLFSSFFLFLPQKEDMITKSRRFQ